jgi:WD repeat-containing protein 23
MSAGWESGRGGSIVARHEWKGLSKMAGSLEDWVGKKAEEQKESITPKSADRRSGRRRSRTLYVPGAFESEEED